MSDGVWMSVSEVAGARGISKQAVSKRLKNLGGKVSTRVEGRQLLLNIAEFDRVTGAETDPAQALRNRHLADRQPDEGQEPGAMPAPARPVDLAQKVYSQQRAKRESYEAEKSRLDLEERIGKLLPIDQVEAAMVRCASAIVRVIDQLPAMSDDPAIKTLLKAKAREVRDTLAAEMKLLPRDDAGNTTDLDNS